MIDIINGLGTISQDQIGTVIAPKHQKPLAH